MNFTNNWIATTTFLLQHHGCCDYSCDDAGKSLSSVLALLLRQYQSHFIVGIILPKTVY